MLEDSNRIRRDREGYSENFAEYQAMRKAESQTEQWNEPIRVFANDKEFVLVRDIAWRARDSWGKDSIPSWALKDPEGSLFALVEPKDNLKGNYAKAKKRVEAMVEANRKVYQEQRFHLEQLCRDYPEVRGQLSMIASAGQHMENLLAFLSSDVYTAIEQNKKGIRPRRLEDED